MRKHIVNKRVRELTVCTAVENDAVLTRSVHLNDGMTIRAITMAHKIDIHTGSGHFLAQKLSLAADEARVVDLCACTRQCNGLIQSLAAAADAELRTSERFSGLDKMLHLIDVINIARADVYNFHTRISLSAVLSFTIAQAGEKCKHFFCPPHLIPFFSL